MTSVSGSDERFREFTRAPLEVPVTLQLDTFSPPEAGFTGDVSVGGMFVRVRTPQPVGTILRFELELDPAGPRLRGTAEVVWIRARTRALDKPPGMGLQFRFFEGDGQAQVRAAVQEAIIAQGLPAEPETGPEVVARRAAPTATPTRPPPPAAPPTPQPEKRPERPRHRAPAKPAPAPTILGLPRQATRLVLAVGVLVLLLMLLWALG